jgi:Coenzyme PQQ synthesis protein D (PqqD)
MANLNSIPTPRRDFSLQQMDGETLLYRRSLKKTIYLNESATAVWQLCDGRRTVQQVVDILANAYPEAHAEVAADVNDAIDNLFREGALRLETPVQKSDNT